MPQISDLVITKADDTTSQTWTALVPSAGDRVASVNRQNVVALPGHRGTLSIVARFNQGRTARRVELQIQQPYVKTVDSQEVSDSKSICSLSFIIPQDIPESEVSEHVNNVVKLIGTSMVTSVLETGYAPT